MVRKKKAALAYRTAVITIFFQTYYLDKIAME